jgi:regulation of enolase protein 1 (concanavalin A-like superfamily)
VKCGIEYCDGKSLLSVVVCNVFSDWSTQPWPCCSARLRVHKVLQSSSIVIEAAPTGSSEFHFIRIAHLSSLAIHKGSELTDFERNGTDEESDWKIGPFSASVTQQRGCVATFTNLHVGRRIGMAHSSDVSHMVKEE